MRLAPFAALLAIGCGGAVTEDVQSAAGSASASGAGGGSTGAGTSSAGGGSASSSAGPGGAGGGGGEAPPSSCAGLDYCSCASNAACAVVSEDCFCPCGVEPCEPDCECDCAGGKYLGCAPTSIANPGALEGLWLIGWSGGANHFSWVRIEPGFELTVNDGAALAGNLPHFACNGAGSWLLTAKPETLGLQLPGDCGFASLTFAKWLGTPPWPEGCLQEVLLEDNLVSTPLSACRFPPSQCDEAMTACTDPL